VSIGYLSLEEEVGMLDRFQLASPLEALTPVASTEEILGYAFVMIAGGNDTTTGLIGGAAEMLTDEPGERRLLIDPARPSAPLSDH